MDRCISLFKEPPLLEALGMIRQTKLDGWIPSLAGPQCPRPQATHNFCFFAEVNIQRALASSRSCCTIGRASFPSPHIRLLPAPCYKAAISFPFPLDERVQSDATHASRHPKSFLNPRAHGLSNKSVCFPAKSATTVSSSFACLLPTYTAYPVSVPPGHV